MLLNKENNKHLVLFLDTGIGKVFDVPASIIDFHNEELVDYKNDALAYDFFVEWKKKNKKEIKHNECVGYKVPLFLGGEDAINNLEITDYDVYTSLCGQLRNKTKDLPEGTNINDISIE